MSHEMLSLRQTSMVCLPECPLLCSLIGGEEHTSKHWLSLKPQFELEQDLIRVLSLRRSGSLACIVSYLQSDHGAQTLLWVFTWDPDPPLPLYLAPLPHPQLLPSFLCTLALSSSASLPGGGGIASEPASDHSAQEQLCDHTHRASGDCQRPLSNQAPVERPGTPGLHMNVMEERWTVVSFRWDGLS